MRNYNVRSLESPSLEYASVRVTYDDHDLTGAFQLYDINDDGLISYDEMLQIVSSIYSMTGEMVKLPADEDTAAKVYPFYFSC